MQLYSVPLSPYAARVRAVIYAKGLDVELVHPPEHWRNAPEFLKVNPLGRIPVLVTAEGQAIAESEAIFEYLEEVYPEPALLPANAPDRARVRQLAVAIDTYVLDAALALYNLFESNPKGSPEAERQATLLEDGLVRLDAMMTPGELVFGKSVSYADAWLTPARFFLDGVMKYSGKSRLLDRLPALARYPEVIRAHAPLERVWREMNLAIVRAADRGAAT